MAQITRNNVLPGALDDDFHPGGNVHCSGAPPVQVDVTLSASEVRGAAANPVRIVAPLSRGIAVFGLYWSKAAGAYSGGTDLVLSFQDDTVAASIGGSDLDDASASAGWASRGTIAGLIGSDPDNLSIPNGGLFLTLATDYTSDGGDLTLNVIYVEADL